MTELPEAPSSSQYAVLVMYPDYIADSYGETYLYQGEHENYLDAREAAQKEARKANYADEDLLEFDVSEQDFLVLLVVKGGQVVQ